MRGPFEFLGDLFDYQYNYYRNYAHRRLIFSDYTWEQFYEDTHFNVFRNNDAENVGKLIRQTTLVGLGAGATIAPLKWAIMREINKIPARQCLPVMAGILLVGGSSLQFCFSINNQKLKL